MGQVPPELVPILKEISRPASSLQEMPYRIELCRRALAAVRREENAKLWAVLHNKLANNFAQSSQGSRAYNLEQALTHYEQALTVCTREGFPADWAAIQHNLASTYRERICGERAGNLEQALAHCQQALTVYTREDFAADWAAIQHNLAVVYRERIRGERADNLEQALAHYEQALRVRTRKAFPPDWAMTQHNLANAYRERIRGERADNLEQALAHCQQALTVYTQEGFPADWAMTQYSLANVYGERIRGERADNLELALAHCQQALTVYTREGFPADWAATQHNLSVVYRERIRGERADNLEQALAHCQQALMGYTREGFPADWAAIQHNLANVYRERIRGERADNLEQALAHYEQALKVYTREGFPVDWAMTQNNLANAYRERIRGERADNLEQALAHCQQALTVYTREAFPADWAATQHNLANVYRERIRGERADNQEQALAHYEQALKVRTREAFPPDWAMTQHNLGLTYRERIRGERADNLEQALTHCQQALTVYTQEGFPANWAMTQDNLANVYGERICGERADNLEQALVHCQQALTVYTREGFPADWAATQYNLAIAHHERIRGERADNLEQALAHYEQALRVYTREGFPADWAMTQHSLGITYRERIRGERADNLEQALAHCQQALTVYTREGFPTDWAAIQHNLAVFYRERICGERADNLKQAFVHYEQALTVYTLQHFPASFQQTQRNLGHLHFAEGAWTAAFEAYQKAIQAEQLLLGAAYTEVGRREEVAQTAVLYGCITYALLKLGRADEALVQLERGKTRLLRQALALDEVNLLKLADPTQSSLRRLRQMIQNLEYEMRVPLDIHVQHDERRLAERLDKARGQLTNMITHIRAAHPDFMQEGLHLSEILTLITPGVALVVPLVTPRGSAVFVVPTGQQSVRREHVLLLNEFKESDLEALIKGPALDPSEEPRVGGWLGAYFNTEHNASVWRDTINATGQALWAKLMAPIAERLATLQVSHVLLMPQAGLTLLPLHAAWREVNGAKRYFLDDYSVTYLPSIYTHKVGLERMSDPQRHSGSLLAVVNPTKDLKFGTTEGEKVASLFEDDKVTVLVGTDATATTVMGHRSTGYVHFSCHGFYNWDDPMQSGLVLANDEPLTLGQVIGKLNLDKTRLVTLSACETGITDIRQSPGEYLGLPAGFLQAGAPAVVSTLWEVNDLSTMLLMERFYQLHLKEGKELPEALRQAQIWLRDVTAGELAKRFAGEEEAILSSTRLPIETASAYFARFASLDPSQRPFAHPYYWAPFTFSGA